MSEPNQIFIAPAPGRRVKDPHTLQLLNPEGEWKPEISYWLRRLNDEDVVKVSPPRETKAEKVKSKNTPEKES